MEKEQRNAIASSAQQIRSLLEEEFGEQLDGVFDIRATGEIASAPGDHLGPDQRVARAKIVAALDYFQSQGLDPVDAVARFVREAAFTTMNRFVALKMLEERELVQQCVSAGEESSGYQEFIGLAPGIVQLEDGAGYRLYLESLFDELTAEVKALFDRTDTASLLWPRRNAFDELLEELNDSPLTGVWADDETIGWYYQFFNSKEERQQMRDESQAPRNSRELAVRNQFFTPRYVVEFLVDNTLARTWSEMHPESTLLTSCEYFVDLEEERPNRELKDPRELRVLDPACGSGHFLLCAFATLEQIYLDAFNAGLTSASWPEQSLQETYADERALRAALPTLILERNLFGIDIDPRAAQIAALALWLRAQRSWRDAGVPAADRPRVRQTGIVVAEPIPADPELVDNFAETLDPPLLGTLFRHMVHDTELASEMGYLLRSEQELGAEVRRAHDAFVAQRLEPMTLPGLAEENAENGAQFEGIDEEQFFAEAEHRLLESLIAFSTNAQGAENARRKMFADDAAAGVALVEVVRNQYDVILMNPPFGAGSLKAKKHFDKAYPRTKNDVYAAFVERGIELLVPSGMLGAITSRTGFFLSSFQKWREEIILETAPPLVFADLGVGVLDGAMVEVAAYCLEASR